ncbi:MAG: hypothetical protein IKI11_11780 [Neisseriaceae bacterium]|nr:hypothetical protein [Neisseriaceae bacterium]
MPPHFGVGYNRNICMVGGTGVIAAPPKIGWAIYLKRYEQAVIRAVWLKDARVVCVCIRTKGVSTYPHNNPPSNQNRQVKTCRFCLFISSLQVFQAA